MHIEHWITIPETDSTDEIEIKLDIEFHVFDMHRAATMIDPEEFAEIEYDSITGPDGETWDELTLKQLAEIDQACWDSLE